ncbi:hypothetical protein XELAEV_18035595mg [Xenopus laevis]|uniref:Uncharacterized protein n=1 Tax=Xenopus laevis TaxID=8355 RepID=A0A974CFT4_XENLA|nr:hypothetical protein XELAEV_18035595mg [Xenopus laevis]
MVLAFIYHLVPCRHLSSNFSYSSCHFSLNRWIFERIPLCIADIGNKVNLSLPILSHIYLCALGDSTAWSVQEKQ